MEPSDVLIIGAGISGLICATELKATGHSVRLLDKGRGVGGRMATRQMAGGRLDHGAQYFTVRDPRLQAYVDVWLEAGVIKKWFTHLPEDSSPEGYPRYCGVQGMTDVPKFLARDLELHNSQQVTELSRDSDLWIARTATGDSFLARHLVVTAPLPQALNLLDTSGLRYANGDAEALRAVCYERGLAALLVLRGPSGLAKPGGRKIHSGPLTWMADNQQKGISPELTTVTLHASAEFADAHWDSSDAVRGPLMLAAAAPYLQSEVMECSCHRWGFTRPVNPWPEPYYQNAGLQLTLAGDSFGGARVEGAVLSGIEAAAAVGLARAEATIGSVASLD
ncbi:MAG: FAD-dependent oxidoreductase [Puniceicoccaceae bacterium]|nr:MAG: FAD-dependent oxidoreductase [Puniceicoccaceae bacterium]